MTRSITDARAIRTGPLWADRVSVRVEEDLSELRARQDIKRRAGSAESLFNEALSAAQLRHGVREWWRGSHQQRAEAAMHRGEEQLAALLSGDELVAYARDIVESARASLDRNDPRIPPVGRALGDNGATLRPIEVSHLARAVYEAQEEQSAQSRGFRNRLIRLIAVSLLGLAGLMASIALNGIELAVKGSSPSYIKVGLLVTLFGALGALIAGVPPLARAGGTWNPFSLPWYQMLLKLALGPIFAVIGVMMLQSSVIPNVEFPMPLPDLLLWALAFGAAQQAVTRSVDTRVQTLISSSPAPSAASGISAALVAGGGGVSRDTPTAGGVVTPDT